jgi:hypothetical protein
MNNSMANKKKEQWYVYGIVSIIAVWLTYFAFTDYETFIRPDHTQSGRNSKVFLLIVNVIDLLGGRWLVLTVMLAIVVFLLMKTFQHLKPARYAKESDSTPSVPMPDDKILVTRIERPFDQNEYSMTAVSSMDNDGHPMIHLRGKVDTFDFFTPAGEGFSSRTRHLNSFKHWKRISSFLLSIRPGGDAILFDLSGPSEETKVMTLFWGNFNNRELQELASAFAFDVRQVKDDNAEANMSASIKGTEAMESRWAMMAVKSDQGFDYVAIYSSDFPDKTSEGMLYVHGIWCVNFSGELKRKLEVQRQVTG